MRFVSNNRLPRSQGTTRSARGMEPTKGIEEKEENLQSTDQNFADSMQRSDSNRPVSTFFYYSVLQYKCALKELNPFFAVAQLFCERLYSP